MDLSEIRQHINRIDAQMKGLFLERMSFAAKVAEEKRCTGGSVFVPEREREILQMRQKDVGPELAMECRAFFGQLMGISRTYQYAKLAGVCSRAGEIPDRPGAVLWGREWGFCVSLECNITWRAFGVGVLGRAGRRRQPAL